MPRMSHILGLVALILLVAYFGVWRGSEAIAQHFGWAWGMVAAALLLAGLAVIAAAGIVVVRTIRAVEPGAARRQKKVGNQPD